ncbi:methionyl-tRNA synthetase [Coemansia sp. 'formosensis']|nr:methionyl-tRNA synthetase [Coemansia sp. 'formosensis']
MAAGLPLPKRILAHAHWTMGSQKMSKSKGNVADPFEAIERYGLDTLRYFMIRNGGIADDGDYSADEVLVRHRKDLAGQLANLAARCSSERLGVNLDGFAALGQKLQHHVEGRDAALHAMLSELPGKAKTLFDKGEFGRGLGLAFDVLAEANRHITENEPWTLVKSSDPSQQVRLQVVLFYSLEAVRLASILLLPTIPEKANRLLDHIAIERSERQWANAKFGAGWQSSGPKHLLPGVATLFPKLA